MFVGMRGSKGFERRTRMLGRVLFSDGIDTTHLYFSWR